MSENYILYSEKVLLGAQIKIWNILMDYITDPEYMQTLSIWEICKIYKINKRTLKKYLKRYYKKHITGGNRLCLCIDDENLIFFMTHIKKIVDQYSWYIDNNNIKIWQYLLNNMRVWAR